MTGVPDTCLVKPHTGDTPPPPPQHDGPELGSIWLSLGLVEMSESESESQGSSLRGSAVESRPIQCRGMGAMDSGEDLMGTDYSTDVSGTWKNKRPITSRAWEKGSASKSSK